MHSAIDLRLVLITTKSWLAVVDAIRMGRCLTYHQNPPPFWNAPQFSSMQPHNHIEYSGTSKLLELELIDHPFYGSLSGVRAESYNTVLQFSSICEGDETSHLRWCRLRNLRYALPQ